MLNLTKLSFTFRVRRKWNLLQYCTSIVSMDYAKFKIIDENESASISDSISDILDAYQVKIQLVTIYAGVIGIIFEGNYSNDHLVPHLFSFNQNI